MSDSDTTDIDEPRKKLTKYGMSQTFTQPEEEMDEDGQEEWLSEGMLTDEDCNPASEHDRNDSATGNVNTSQDNSTKVDDSNIEHELNSMNNKQKDELPDDLDTFLIRKTDISKPDDEESDGNDTDDLLRMLEDDGKTKKKKKVKFSAKERQDTEEHSSGDDDDDFVYDGAAVKKLRVAKTVLMRKMPALKAEAEDTTEDSDETSDEVNTVKNMFGVRKSGNFAAKSTAKPHIDTPRPPSKNTVTAIKKPGNSISHIVKKASETRPVTSTPIRQNPNRVLQSKAILKSSPTNQKSDQPANQKPGQMANQKSGQTANQKTGQTANQKTGQTANQKTGPTANQKTGQTANQKTGPTANQKTGQTANQKTGPTANQKTGQTANQKTGQTANQKSAQTANQKSAQTANQKSGQLTNQKSGQPVKQPASQPVKQPVGKLNDQPIRVVKKVVVHMDKKPQYKELLKDQKEKPKEFDEIINEEEFLDEDEFDLDEDFADESDSELDRRALKRRTSEIVEKLMQSEQLDAEMYSDEDSQADDDDGSLYDNEPVQKLMKPEQFDEEMYSDEDSQEDDDSLYDELPSSDSDDLHDWFTLDIRAERAADYLPLLGTKAHQLLLEEKNRVTSRLDDMRRKLASLTDNTRQRGDKVRAAASELGEIEDMIKAA